MCGRYTIFPEVDSPEIMDILMRLEEDHQHTPEFSQMKTGEIYPTNVVPIIGKHGASLMTWGVKPFDRTNLIINARSETASEKPMFSRSLKERRIAIPTTGFYEWKHEGKQNNVKFLFRLPDSCVLYLTGVYAEYVTQDGRKDMRFVILTTDANESMLPYHNRMPVYVAQSELDAWIYDDQSTEDILHRSQPMLTASPANKPKAEQLSLF